MSAPAISTHDFRRRLLIVRLGALGDIVHAVPAQQALMQQLPELEIHWAADPAYVPLLSCVPGISRVWSLDTRGSGTSRQRRLGHWYDLARSLRRQNFDLALDFQGLLKSALLARISGARRVYGFKPERFKEKGIGWFYSKTVSGEADLHRHVVKSNLELVRLLTPNAKEVRPLPLRIPDSAQAYVDGQLKRLSINNPVLINPGAGWVTKLWPAENYAELASQIQRDLGLPVVLTYGPGEEPLIEAVQRHGKRAALPAFPTGLVELAALLRRSRLMIGGDSGPLHLAGLIGTPSVFIMGPTTALRNGPYDLADPVVQRALPCSNCYKRTCDAFICMDIPVASVRKAVEQRLETMTDKVPAPVLTASQR